MDELLGVIKMTAINFAPEDYAYCNGAIIAIGQNPSLYSLIATAYGGDGRSSFGLPDFRARVPVGSSDMGIAPGLLENFPRGYKDGQQIVTISTDQMPAHHHLAAFEGDIAPVWVTNASMTATATLNAKSDGAGNTDPIPNDYISGGGTSQIFGSGGLGVTDVPLQGVDVSVTLDAFSASVTPTGTVAVGNTGEGGPILILNPFESVNFIICTNGLYPSRP